MALTREGCWLLVITITHVVWGEVYVAHVLIEQTRRHGCIKCCSASVGYDNTSHHIQVVSKGRVFKCGSPSLGLPDGLTMLVTLLK